MRLRVALLDERGRAGAARASRGCSGEMPAGREDEMCGKALELLSELCSRGEVHSDKCADFIYSFRDLGRPDYSDPGKFRLRKLDFLPASARALQCCLLSFNTDARAFPSSARVFLKVMLSKILSHVLLSAN